MPETSRTETEETEPTPEEVVEEAAEEVLTPEELKARAESIKNREAFLNAAGYVKGGVKSGAGVAFGGFIFAAKIVQGLVSFAKRAIEKGGKVSFGEGYKMGEWSINPESKKDKK